MKNRIFTYTPENYTEQNPINHGNFLNCPAHRKDIQPFLNGVAPIFRTINSPTSEEEEIKGKTIDYTSWNEKDGSIFIGFTDGTFIIRHLIEYEIGEYRNSYWSFCPVLPSCFCVYDGELFYLDNGINSASEDNKYEVKITGIGRWIEEHTDADIIGFYEKVKEERLEIVERLNKEQEERDKKYFEHLKQKYNW